MLITIKEGIISTDKTDFIYFNKNWMFWFKGYFFIEDNYYTGKAACEIISGKLTTEGVGNPDVLNGIYQCVMFNKDKQKMFVVNDRFGFHQLFYFISKAVFFIGDDFWEVARNAGAREIDEVSLLEFLQFRFVSGKYTLAKDVFCIEPSSVYSVDFSIPIVAIKRKQYWQFRYNPTIGSKAIAEERIYNTLNGIIGKYKKSVFGDKEIGINLTGGLDSRYILGLLLQNNVPKEKIRSYTFGSSTCGDLKIAREITSFLGVKNHEEIFDEYFTDFFDNKNIMDILKDIGFFTYYLQGYGFKKLNGMYKDVGYLLSGMDGFILSINASPELFNITDHRQVADYIYKVNATILSEQECSLVSGFEPLLIKQKIFKRINENIDKTLDPVSAYYDWTFRNRNRKYLLSIYGFQNRNTTHLLQYYDYGFVDLMSKMPASFILGQIPYINSMYKNVFIGQLEKLRSIPIEKRGVYYKKGEDYIEKAKPRITVKKIIDKLFNPADSSFPYPIQKILRNSNGVFGKVFIELRKDGSKYLDISNCIGLIEKNKRSNNFTRYGLVAILSVAIFEAMINNNKNGK